MDSGNAYLAAAEHHRIAQPADDRGQRQRRGDRDRGDRDGEWAQPARATADGDVLQQLAHAGGGPGPAPTPINPLLPEELAVRACPAVPAGFDARRDARSRSYCYRVLARR